MSVNLAIIGCGGMARRFHLNAYFHIMRTVPEKLDLVAFCDPVRERRRSTRRSRKRDNKYYDQ